MKHTATILVACCLFLILPSPAARGSDTPEESVDIVGLKLGMTRDEAVAALQAYKPQFQLSEMPIDVTIPDSNRRPFQVTSYVKELRAIWDQGVKGYEPGALWKEQIVVVFSPPPREHCVQYIRRVVRYNPGQGPALEGTIVAIAQKYGPAAHTQVQGNSVIQLWLPGGESLTDTEFLQWFNKSRIGGDLRQPGAEGGTAIQNGRHLGVYVVPYGQGISMLGFVLSESQSTMNLWREETRKMAEAVLEEHEAELRQETGQRDIPQL